MENNNLQDQYGVSFNETNVKRSFSTQTPKIVRLLVKYSRGVIKNEKQANLVFLVFIALTTIISLFLIFNGGSIELPSEEEILRDTPTTIPVENY